MKIIIEAIAAAIIVILVVKITMLALDGKKDTIAPAAPIIVTK